MIGPLGRGGMGTVLEVEDAEGARYALKSPVMDPTGEVARRFAREANAMRLLDHPNLVAAIEVFVDSGQLFLVMEKVTGRTLGEAMPVAPRQALVLARQIIDGVASAHGHELVHRDLKPDNVLLVDMGGWERVKVIDFGLVKLVGDAAAAFGASALTRTGLVFGTPQYMAPEQALGLAVDGRADLYSIGVMLHEMLAGAPPFSDPDPYVLMRLQAKAPPPNLAAIANGAPWCTPEILALVGIALAKDPKHRFATANVMRAALDRAFASLDHV